MKKAIVVILLFLAGCNSQVLTWQPTPEEWAAMTPEQRNEWTANEMGARQTRDEAWQRYLQGLQQVEVPERTFEVIPTSQAAPSYNPYTEEEKYYRRKNMEETYRQNFAPAPRISDRPYE